MSAKKIFLGPVISGEGRLWCDDNVWLESEQNDVDEYVHASDPRLSSDPLVALAAVIREHECEFNHGNGVFEIYDRDSNLLLTHKHGTVGCLDIEPESSNKTSCYCGKNNFTGDRQKCCDNEDCIPY